MKAIAKRGSALLIVLAALLALAGGRRQAGLWTLLGQPPARFRPSDETPRPQGSPLRGLPCGLVIFAASGSENAGGACCRTS